MAPLYDLLKGKNPWEQKTLIDRSNKLSRLYRTTGVNKHARQVDPDYTT